MSDKDKIPQINKAYDPKAIYEVQHKSWKRYFRSSYSSTRNTTSTVVRYCFYLLFFGAVGFWGYNHPDSVRKGYNILMWKINPCGTPITYSLGTFDKRFGLEQKDFLKNIDKAKTIWEEPLAKDLFQYVETGGDITINLIYDKRQSSTDKLETIGETINGGKNTYNKLKSEYDSLSAKYNQDKKEFNSLTSSYGDAVAAYNKKVANRNTSGGTSPEDYQQLNREKISLEADARIIQQKQDALNKQVPILNSTAEEINALISKLNLNVSKYNTIGETVGDEFEEGEYVTKNIDRQINIYQFENNIKLVRVLAHELGHALGLEHVNSNSKAIMYYLNVGTNDNITDDDVKALETLCRVR